MASRKPRKTAKPLHKAGDFPGGFDPHFNSLAMVEMKSNQLPTSRKRLRSGTSKAAIRLAKKRKNEKPPEGWVEFKQCKTSQKLVEDLPYELKTRIFNLLNHSSKVMVGLAIPSFYPVARSHIMLKNSNVKIRQQFCAYCDPQVSDDSCDQLPADIIHNHDWDYMSNRVGMWKGLAGRKFSRFRGYVKVEDSQA